MLPEKRPGLYVLWPAAERQDSPEMRCCDSFCRDFTRKALAESGCEAQWLEYPAGGLRAGLAALKGNPRVILVSDRTLMLPARVLEGLVQALDQGCAVAGPMYNQSVCAEQTADMPAPYLNLSSYEEVLALAGGPWMIEGIERLDGSCLAAKKDVLLDLLQSGRLTEPARPVSCAAQSAVIVGGPFVHRFGDYYGGNRQDLVDLVPQGVQNVLDIGCARGEYGKALRRLRPEISLTGVEINKAMAAEAAKTYQQVHCLQVEDLPPDSTFDLINCGDVLEHLEDPWSMLNRIGAMLNRPGYLVLSVPNIGHWSVVKDLLQGKFEYVPWGLLCITHLRWFTESSLRRALQEAGLEIDLLQRTQAPPTPQGREFVAAMRSSGYGNEESLLTNELIVRAVRP